MKWFPFLSRRNYAVSEVHTIQSGRPVYTSWSIHKAVSEGYKTNGWVFRAVYLIAKAVAQVPFSVYADGTKLPDHHISRLFKRPNPCISRQDLFELLVTWLELSGNAYLKKVEVEGRTRELWPVSPDRIRPVAGTRTDEWVKGYTLDMSGSIAFMPEEIIHMKFMNPANPLVGISPLEVAGKAVDTDTSQQDFNTAASQNRGVVEGVFTFERSFDNQDQAEAISQKLEEKIRQRRKFMVLGANAKYQRIALTPEEMDFANARRFNRDEIFTIFGVPPQYAGSTESSTYNNFQTSELIFWSATVIPLLDDIKDAFNFSLEEEMHEGEQIGYDLSRVPAIRRAYHERAKTAKLLREMGVPFSQINRIFDFGVEPYPGWDATKTE